MHSHNRTLLAKLGFADPDKKLPRHDLGCQYVALPEQHEKIVRMVAKRYEKPATQWHSFIERAAASGLCIRRKPSGALEPKTEDQMSEPEIAMLREKLGCGSSVPSVWEYLPDTNVVALFAPRLEHVVQKGTGAYATTIGFLDDVLPTKYGQRTVRITTRYQHTPVPEGLNVGERMLYILSQATPERLNEDMFVEFEVHVEEDPKPKETVVEVKITPVPISDALRQLNLYRAHYDARYWVLATDYDVTKEDVSLLSREDIMHVRLGAAFDRYVAVREASKSMAALSPEI